MGEGITAACRMTDPISVNNKYLNNLTCLIRAKALGDNTNLRFISLQALFFKSKILCLFLNYLNRIYIYINIFSINIVDFEPALLSDDDFLVVGVHLCVAQATESTPYFMDCQPTNNSHAIFFSLVLNSNSNKNYKIYT